MSRDDLQQVALLGLVKAVDRFDPELGYAFTSFAKPTIEGEIKRHFRDTTWSTHVPRSMQELNAAMRQATDRLRQQLGRSPTPKELAADLRVPLDDVVQAVAASAAYRAESLDPPTADAVGPATPHEPDPTPASDDRVVLEDLVGALPEREQEIVRLRFYEELSQSEIAARLGISQMHVSRLLRHSFALMREHAADQGITDDLAP